MPDNDWFIATLPNDPQAQTAVGAHSYVLRAVKLNPAGQASNLFIARSDGTVSIPAGSAFNYISSPRGFEDFQILYPNLDADEPACFNPDTVTFCDPQTDPNCCLNPTRYDGSWSFCFVVPEPIDTLDIWDGDFDYGSASRDSEGNCIKPDGVNLDTDDPNTPIPLPEWAINTDAITQSARIPTEPADDNGCSNLTVRPPSVIYDLVGPNGEIYTNVNPSGNIEWELFNIRTLPFNPSLYDISVESIEPGLWCVKTFGNDMQNLNSFRLPYAVIGIDDEGNPVFPGEPPTDVPTLNQWGLIIFSAFVLLASVYYLRRKRVCI